MSTLMGGILLVNMIAQVIMIGEWYMATLQFLILSIIQICLSRYVLLGYKKL
jgi:membrane protein implicated in regulation of membrane protease activity